MIEPRHRTIVDVECETFLRLTAERKPDRGPDRAAMRDDDDVPARLLGVDALDGAASAIWAAGFPEPSGMPHVNAFAEQHLGEWQGLNRAAFLASRPAGSHWFAAIDEPAPGGESFMDLYHRVCGAIARITEEQAGMDVIAVTHGGTIKAAVGLALGGLPEKGLAFDIDNCSVTRLDHIASGSHAIWRLPMVNQQPWIADASHKAMHQPAGPEVKPPETKLA